MRRQAVLLSLESAIFVQIWRAGWHAADIAALLPEVDITNNNSESPSVCVCVLARARACAYTQCVRETLNRKPRGEWVRICRV